MNDNIIFGINTSLPLLILMALGIFLRKRHMLDDSYIEKTNDLLFWLVGPSIILHNMLGADLKSIWDWKLVVYIYCFLIVTFIALWIFSSLGIRNKSARGAFVHGAFRANFGYIGVPLIMLLFPAQVSAKASLIQVITMPIVNILAVLLLSYCSHENKPGNLLGPILKNPLLLAAVFALAVAGFQIQIPQVIRITIGLLAQLSLPLSLIVIGASFDKDAFKETFRLAFTASFIKSVLFPIIAVSGAILLGISSTDLAIVFIYGATPCAINAYIMTRKMHCDYNLNAAIILLSTLMSSVTLFLGMYILTSMGLF